MGRDSVAVRIAGHEYKIRSDGDPEALREIATYVDRAMVRVRDRTGTVDTLDVSVLTCLNLAREILALREERTPAGSTAVDEDKLRSLIERVETTLGQVSETSSADLEESDVALASTAGTEGQGERNDSGSSTRTLELPSVEALRDRAAARGETDDTSVATEELPEALVAAGGRDRAS